MSALEAAAPEERGETLTFSQRLSLPSFLGLSLKNGLLNLVTLTLYRFWGKTEVRRRVWGATYLNDEPFEYTGRGVELFLGFLFALGVVGLPFLLLSFGAQLLDPALFALLILPMYLFMFFLFGFGIFSAFRYMASRTTWRGVRFQLIGSGKEYGLHYIGYAFLGGMTFGWYMPTAQRKLAEPLWAGLRFGDRRFRFLMWSAEEQGIYGPYAIGWFGTIVAYGLFVAAVAFAGPAFGFGSEGSAEMSLGQIVFMYAGLAMLMLVLAVVYAPYQAALLRSITAGIRFEDVRFSMKVRWWETASLTITNLLLLGVSLGFLMPYVQARTAKFLISRLRADGVVDLDDVRQTRRGPRTGEGLADAFGVGAI